MGFFSAATNTKPNCGKCGLYSSAVNPMMGFQGQGNKKILILTKAPSSQQDRTNNLYAGEATELFRKELSEVGIDLYEDCWIVSALGCASANLNSAQSKNKVDYCRNRLKKYIHDLKPNIILCLSSTALYAIFGEKIGNDQVTGISTETFRSYLIPNYEYNCNVVAIYHPVEALQNQDDIFWTSLWKRDIKQFSKWVGASLKKEVDHRKQVRCLYDFEEVKKALTDLPTNSPEWCVHDYEGSNHHLFLPNSRIESISFSPIYDIKNFKREEQIAYSFPYQRQNHFTLDQQQEIKKLWISYLVFEDIKKIAHNLTLEYSWELVGFGTDTQGEYWDSFVAANQMNCTPGSRSLKHLALMYEGIKGYGSEAKKYFERKQENGLNYIHEFPLNKLLLYGGLDSLLNVFVFVEQYKFFKLGSTRSFGPKSAALWYNKIAKEMARYHAEGVDIDLDYYKETKKELLIEFNDVVEQLNNSKETKLFVSRENRLPNYGSAPDLRKLFFEYGGHEVVKQTDGGDSSVDKESMYELKGDCADLLLRMRELDKVINTYIGQFEKLSIDGKVHPTFNVSLKTMRTSCNGPNLQNISKHNKLQKKLVRRGIKADKDCHFVEVDFAGIELYMNAFICNDSEFMKMLSTPGIDAHSEFCKFWYDFTNEQISKPIRNFSKTGVTFAEAYGSNYYACARKTWEWFNNEEVFTGEGFSLVDHFRIKGIKTERDLIDFWKEKEEIYWDRFKEWKAYQEKTVEIYLEKGYVETPSGYRRTGMMSKNKVLNTPPQNAGAFVLLASACYINQEARKEKMKSRLSLQVHDSNGGSVYKDEKQEFLDLVEYGMTEWSFKTFDFLKLKLGVEVEMSPEPNQSWYDLVVWEKDGNGIWKPKEN